ncbi:MHS family MFS transporter [Mycobacterium sp. 21AC1]|uniref:MFS transporter n=1 Tax=[Mycobacterium] appelbergii TaxID=2939269 RepID=UPI00293906BD|nr:MFS transporter [Mycobacterium sp. 21AC1]MDV3125442.1 MHS family MFS transporter [Mycobacterium sp. 21AC1]
MSTNAGTSTPDMAGLTGNPHGTPNRLRAAFGSAAGTTVENFDFVAYGTAAALYFGDVFFPNEDPLVGTLLSFSTFALGFVVRPLGGLLGGYFADRIGRRPVLIVALIVMGLATAAIGLLPTYASVGALAPVLLTVCRLIQGLAYGAEWGGAVLLTYEHAPWKHRGLYTAIPQAGVPFGNMAASLVFLATVALPGDLAWRVPFLSSIVLVSVGLFLRMRVQESPAFTEAKEAGSVERNPVTSMLRHSWRNLIRALFLRAAENAGYAIGITYISSYLVQRDLGERSTAVMAIAIAAGVGCVAVLLWGNLADKIGRRTVYLIVSAGMAVFAVPIFIMLNTGIVGVIIVVFLITFCFVENGMAAVQAPWFSELFPVATRASGISMAYQFAAVIGGFTPLIAVALYGALGWIGPALLYAAFGLLGFCSALATPETWGRERRAEVAALVAEFDDLCDPMVPAAK